MLTTSVIHEQLFFTVMAQVLSPPQLSHSTMSQSQPIDPLPILPKKNQQLSSRHFYAPSLFISIFCLISPICIKFYSILTGFVWFGFVTSDQDSTDILL